MREGFGRMDYKTVLRSIIKEFEANNVHYALIGGFALGLWGVIRATMDLDFLAARDDMGRIDAIVSALGYKSFYRTENLTQYRAENEVYGELDFLHAFRSHSMGMLKRAGTKQVFGGEIVLKVLLPEDLIGLKVQAMVNDPRRRAVDMSDIESLIDLHEKSMDWPLVEEYFSMFGMADVVKEIRGRHEDR